MEDRLEQMFAAQREVQAVIAVDPVIILDQDERIDYIRTQVLACVAELMEMLDEIGWKPWATSRHVNENAAFGELRDAWQFLMNLMMAVTLAPPEEVAARLHAELLEKHVINYHRALNDYDGVDGKCRQCHRDLAEVEVKEVRATSTDRVDLHCVCGAYLGSRTV